MPNIKLKISIIILIAILSTDKLSARDNPIDTSILWREFVMLEAVFHDTTHLSFNSTIYFIDSASVVTRDTLQVAYKLSNQKYKIVTDSTEIIQNDFYHVAVHNDQGLVILNRPIGFGINLFQTHLMDTLFNRLFVQGLHATDSAGYRKLSFQFKTGSPFSRYEILYDTTNYHISRIEYRILKDPATPGVTDNYQVRVVCSDYTSGTFNDTAFSTSSYFIRKQGIVNLLSPYAGYELINNTQNQ